MGALDQQNGRIIEIFSVAAWWTTRRINLLNANCETRGNSISGRATFQPKLCVLLWGSMACIVENASWSLAVARAPSGGLSFNGALMPCRGVQSSSSSSSSGFYHHRGFRRCTDPPWWFECGAIPRHSVLTTRQISHLAFGFSSLRNEYLLNVHGRNGKSLLHIGGEVGQTDWKRDGHFLGIVG